MDRGFIDIPYDERVAGHNRRLARYFQHALIENSPWRIARFAATGEYVGENERLRGFHDAETGLCTWWPARLMAHGTAYSAFGIADRSFIAEIEINLLSDGTLHLPYDERFRPEETFADTPLARSLVDGCLAVRGRLILLDGRRIHLGKPEAARQ